MGLPFLFPDCECLLICLTVSSRKNLSIAPDLSEVLHFIPRALAEVTPTCDFCYTFTVVNGS